jgi:hypothetical protein
MQWSPHEMSMQAMRGGNGLIPNHSPPRRQKVSTTPRNNNKNKNNNTVFGIYSVPILLSNFFFVAGRLKW